MKRILITLQFIILSHAALSQETASKGEGSMIFSNFWTSPQGIDGPKKELAELLTLLVTPGTNLTGNKDIIVYEGVHFLMPLAEAQAALKLPSRPDSRLPLTAPGLPKESLVGYQYAGVFNGKYDNLYLIADKADQVVSVLLVSENPPETGISGGGKLDRKVYNFVLGRSKSSTNVRVSQSLKYMKKGTGIRASTSYGPLPLDLESPTTQEIKDAVTVIVIEAAAKTATSGRPGYRPSDKVKSIEYSQWYIPRPLAEVILHCCLR